MDDLDDCCVVIWAHTSTLNYPPTHLHTCRRPLSGFPDNFLLNEIQYVSLLYQARVLPLCGHYVTVVLWLCVWLRKHNELNEPTRPWHKGNPFYPQLLHTGPIRGCYHHTRPCCSTVSQKVRTLHTLYTNQLLQRDSGNKFFQTTAQLKHFKWNYRLFILLPVK